ncbi:Pentatricopeptide repeat-containing protein, mitochondrial [Ananas comosus]|uniref:Pentatricopeptide repeat-containing protein, mitochondrial n=1 Tax=Ananas comosus TaxID=4615 RepID=A0A199VBY0_ANACO|nr:Pentatricopeptide repeat-containing protein, mitochondrial [Ananas comosus]
MPRGRRRDRDRVSYTALITTISPADRPDESLRLLRSMARDGVPFAAVALAAVLSAFARHRSAPGAAATAAVATMVHAAAARSGLGASVVVGTSLVHSYCASSRLADARKVFDEMGRTRNTVTWNALLNGYAKAGLADRAAELFAAIPEPDLVSWSTMVDGCLRAGRLSAALSTYNAMLRSPAGARPNEVLLVDLLSACARRSAVEEGRQLHAAIAKAGLDRHAFVQSTLIHFYGACGFLNSARLQFVSGSKDHVSSWNALMAGLVRSGNADEALRLFDAMPERDVVSWSTVIAGHAQCGRSGLALELFRRMRATGVEPNEITLTSALSAVAGSGTLEQGKWIHDYVVANSVPLTDNLIAGLIDMYAKRGSIASAMQVFDNARRSSSSISPWNAIICGLAIHGHAETSLSLFSQLRRTDIRPNSITFIGVLNACCHAGLVGAGRSYFESMKREYGIEPAIKHYGCMVDLLGRAGCLEEAERLIEAMPMEADVVIWGTMLAAARTHGNVEIGERAAASLARLEPSHGAARILLSNIYADAGRWSDVATVRRAMQEGEFEKMPGRSGIL